MILITTTLTAKDLLLPFLFQEVGVNFKENYAIASTVINHCRMKGISISKQLTKEHRLYKDKWKYRLIEYYNKGMLFKALSIKLKAIEAALVKPLPYTNYNTSGKFHKGIKLTSKYGAHYFGIVDNKHRRLNKWKR